MNNALFVILLSSIYGAALTWAFRTLPREKWQIIAAIPLAKESTGQWRGLNLTYYGFFMATSNTVAAVMMLVLLGAIGVPVATTFVLMTVIFAICWPAARIIARLVEKKNYTFTVAGALFVGMLTIPWVIQLMNAVINPILNAIWGETFGKKIPVIPTLAASAVAYAYAEGLGRLSCISFGCCYGKQIDGLSPSLNQIFKSINFVFAGATKKVAYEGHLEGKRVVPVQGLNAVIGTIVALIGTYLYLESHFVAALMTIVVVTQVWRILSETLRADYRGQSGIFSAYQMMAMFMIVYLIFIVLRFEPGPSMADIAAGLDSLWDPAILLLCQALWLIIFRITGRSMVTGSTLTFFIHRDRI